MTSTSAPAARLRQLRATDITPALVARKGGLTLRLIEADGTAVIATVRAVRPARGFSDWAEMILDVDGVSRPFRTIGANRLDWVIG